MTTFCSVKPCSKMYRWQFGHISLCQSHWEQWCRSTWQALLCSLEQPVMEDWVAVVGAGEATSGLVIEQQAPEQDYQAWHLEMLSRPILPEE